MTKEIDDINPFVTESLRWHVEIRSLLSAFGEEMSRPLERDDDEAHYLPCQRVADFIKEAGYDGILKKPAGYSIQAFVERDKLNPVRTPRSQSWHRPGFQAVT